MDTMENGYKCTAKWALQAAIGEVAQAKQSLFWAEESAEKRGVEKSKDMVVQANTDRVNIAQEREARERKWRTFLWSPLVCKMTSSHTLFQWSEG